MSNAASYNAMTTKLKAMHARLITPAQYEEIATLASVSEFIAYLKEHTSYAKEFEEADAATLHRRDIEHILPNAVYDDFKKIYLFADQHQRGFLEIYFQNFEASFLKRCIVRVLHDKSISDYDIRYDDFFERHTRFCAADLAKAETIADVVRACEGSAYYPLFSYLLGQPHSSLADYELAINLHYYTHTWKTLNHLNSAHNDADIEMVKAHYGTMIDLCNLAWIRRAKFNFHIDSDKIFHYLIPCRYKISQELLEAFEQCSSIEEFNELLAGSYYGHHFGITTADALHETFDKTIEGVSLKIAKAHPYSIASIYSYLLTKETEKNRLIRALEGIRYGLDAHTILDYMNGGHIK